MGGELVRTWRLGDRVWPLRRCGYRGKSGRARPCRKDRLGNSPRCRKHLRATGLDHLEIYLDRAPIEREAIVEAIQLSRLRAEARRGRGPLATPACWSWPVVAGMSMEEFQQGRCAACGITKYLVWDHDHFTGIGRGQLCRNCNVQEGSSNQRRVRLYRKRPPAAILGEYTRYESSYGEDYGQVVRSQRAWNFLREEDYLNTSYQLSVVGFVSHPDGTVAVPGVDHAVTTADLRRAEEQRYEVARADMRKFYMELAWKHAREADETDDVELARDLRKAAVSLARNNGDEDETQKLLRHITKRISGPGSAATSEGEH